MRKYRLIQFLQESFEFIRTCTTKPSVLVQDSTTKKPIKDAIVTPMSLSMNYMGKKTDQNGCVFFQFQFQKIEWIEVSKEGYQSSGKIPYTAKAPIRIKLKSKHSF
ncbi:MAG: hypothetical protein ACI86H_001127 [bacterium]|jgi:hypothetical protein